MSSITRRITAIGQGAPAMMPVRSDDRSNSAKARMLELGDEHGRHAVKRGAALAATHSSTASGIEAVAREHDRRAHA